MSIWDGNFQQQKIMLELVFQISIIWCRCSTREGIEAQKDVRDKESITDSQPATLGWGDYMGKRLDQANREMARMFGEDRLIPRDDWLSGTCIV